MSLLENFICKKCGVEKPLNTEFFHRSNKSKIGFYGKCKDCRNEERAKYREKNRDKSREYSKKYYQKNKEAHNEYVKKYNKKNEKKMKEYRKEYYNKNKETIKEYIKQWQQENREKERMRMQKRRANERGLEKTLTSEEWTHALDYFDNECVYCGETDVPLEQDHVIPVTRWGGYTRENIVPACKSCNSSKSNKEVRSWFLDQDFYSEDRMIAIEDYIYSSGRTRKVEVYYLSEEDLEKYRSV